MLAKLRPLAMTHRAEGTSRLLAVLALLLSGPLAATPFVDSLFRFTETTHTYSTNAQTDVGTVSLLADVYTPDGVSGDLLPGILFVPGGGLGGTKDDSLPVGVAEGFARRGYVAAAIDYRNTSINIPANEAGPFDAANPTERRINAVISDTTAAVQWFRQNAAQWNMDPNRVILAGSSAGALVAMMVAYEELGPETEVAAVLDLWGSMGGTLNGPGGQNANLGDRTGLIDADDPALFMVHGTADTVVPFSLAQDIEARAQQEGLLHQLVAIDGAGHSPSTEFFAEPAPEPTYFQQAVNFMNGALGLSEVSIVPAPPPLVTLALALILVGSRGWNRPSRRRNAAGAAR